MPEPAGEAQSLSQTVAEALAHRGVFVSDCRRQTGPFEQEQIWLQSQAGVSALLYWLTDDMADQAAMATISTLLAEEALFFLWASVDYVRGARGFGPPVCWRRLAPLAEQQRSRLQSRPLPYWLASVADQARAAAATSRGARSFLQFVDVAVAHREVALPLPATGPPEQEQSQLQQRRLRRATRTARCVRLNDLLGKASGEGLLRLHAQHGEDCDTISTSPPVGVDSRGAHDHT